MSRRFHLCHRSPHPRCCAAWARRARPGGRPQRGALLGWGLEPAAPAGFLFFLAFFNGPAEELFWRGWVLRDPAPGRRALLWTWMRARWQSVWPPLLAHTGATCGYLFVCAKLLDAG